MKKSTVKKSNPVNQKKSLSPKVETLRNQPIPVADTLKSPRKWLRILLPALLLVWLAYALIDGAFENSVTVDELAHLPAGLVYWQTGDFSVYHHNPPLLKLMAAAPLFAAGIKAPEHGYNGNRWELGYLFQQSLGESYHRTFLQARMVIASLTLLLALLLFYVTHHTLGWEAGLVALSLFSFNPLVLAHGALVTTDAGFALAFFTTCVIGVYFFRRPTWKMSLMLGVMLGVALLTKFTALLLLPILILTALMLPWLTSKLNETDKYGWFQLSAGQRWLRLMISLLIAIIVLDAGYLFKGVGQPISSYLLSHPLLHTISSSAIGSLPSPLPAEYVMGFDDQFVESRSGRLFVYLFGQITSKGWWYYYPLALFLKLPIMFHILLCALLVAIVMRKIPMSLFMIGSLAVPLFSLIMFIIFTNIDIGVRYLLFLMPFACIAIAHLAKMKLKKRMQEVLFSVCLLLYAGSVIVCHSNYIAYFSEFIGGPAKGHHYLADSNLDWGQDLLRLKSFMQENDIPTVAMSHFGPVDPSVYGIKYTSINDPAGPEMVVISVNHLLGIDPGAEIVGVQRYRYRMPIATVGYSLWVFNRIKE
ncbi:hypothetical protein ASZ90_008554 [hydrocarbon metagenome]|uniref:Glycosyltransferase RgtA/B/C/D-like domain-containing protein n=1 Tax=hydrocarbon metagenome TaxID=938273 RepID=A0A0W8FLJ8_9ZZZZ